MSIRAIAFVDMAPGRIRRPGTNYEKAESIMAHYLMSVCFDDDDYDDVDWDSDDTKRIITQVSAFNEKLTAAGGWVFAGGLKSAGSATVVRSTDTGVSMTDGPYAETKEQMGGLWVIEAPDFDTALDWAGQATTACERPIEVRPFHDAPTPQPTRRDAQS